MPTQSEIDALFQEVSCFRCNSNASEADLLQLALLQRISDAASIGGTPGLPLESVQFNDGGVFGGDSAFTWNKTTNLLSVTGGIALTGEANETQLAVTGYSLTGANAQSMLSLAGTWNTSGTPTAIDLNITDTASNAASLLMNLRVGGASRFSLTKAGVATFAATVNTTTLVASVNVFIGSLASAVRLNFSANGIGSLSNAANTDFGRLGFGGLTSSFPALKRSSALLQVRLGDDSAYADFEARIVRTTPAFTVGTLPAAGTAGRRTYVTDANATTFASTVAGGGANVVPVFDDGTNWIIA